MSTAPTPIPASTNPLAGSFHSSQIRHHAAGSTGGDSTTVSAALQALDAINAGLLVDQTIGTTLLTEIYANCTQGMTLPAPGTYLFFAMFRVDLDAATLSGGETIEAGLVQNGTVLTGPLTVIFTLPEATLASHTVGHVIIPPALATIADVTHPIHLNAGVTSDPSAGALLVSAPTILALRKS